MDFREELKSAGTYPTGPVSGWPRSRHEELGRQQARLAGTPVPAPVKHDKKVKAGFKKMARGLASNAATAMTKGRVTPSVRKERFDTCKACPHFIESSKRCSECGCMMEMKTWLNGDPDKLCPKQKWLR